MDKDGSVYHIGKYVIYNNPISPMYLRSANERLNLFRLFTLWPKKSSESWWHQIQTLVHSQAFLKGGHSHMVDIFNHCFVRHGNLLCLAHKVPVFLLSWR